MAWPDGAGASNERFTRRRFGQAALGAAAAIALAGRQAAAAASIPPLDQVGPFLAAYGPIRLSRFWTGPACRVRRPSDGALRDIGFTAAGLLDAAVLWGFSGGRPVQLVRAYDQTGNGNHAAAPSGAAPVFDPGQAIGGVPAWLPSVSYGAGGASLPGSTLQYLALPATLQASATALSLFALLRAFDADMPLAYFSLTARSGGTARAVSMLNNATINKLGAGTRLTYFGASAIASARLAQDPSAWLGCALGATAATAWIDGQVLSGLPPGPAANGIAGGVLGAGFNPLTGAWANSYAAWGPVYVAGRAVGTAEAATLEAATRIAVGLTAPAPKVLVATWGDSGTAGLGATDALNRSTLLAARLPSRCRVLDLGYGGKTSGDLLRAFPTDMGPVLAGWPGRKVISLLIGINDVRRGVSGAATWANIARLVALGTASGAGVGALTFPQAPGNSADTVARQATMNALIRANWRGAGALYMADVASDPTLVAAFQTGDATYFHPVGTDAGGHPTTAGYQIFADHDAAALLPVLP